MNVDNSKCLQKQDFKLPMKLFDWLVTQYFVFSSAIARLTEKEKQPATPNLVAKRFRELFVDHGVEETQIPRIFSKITLEDLTSDEALIKKLSPEVINEAAKLFKVRVEWIEGIDETIYGHWSCYKRPQFFFEYLKTIKYDDHSFPFRIITTTQKFDFKDDSHQPFSILFVEKFTDIHDVSINRYQLDRGWSWEEDPCRIQLKAMALLYWKQTRQPITIYKLPKDIYKRIEELTLVPNNYLVGALISNPSLEDYVIDPSESMVSKEADELLAVLKYIDENNLTNMKVFRSTIDSNTLDLLTEESQSDINKVISEMNRKNAKARYEPLDKHKVQFKEFFTLNNYKNKSQAARDYFSSLSLEDKKIVVPTYYDQDHQNCLAKAVRTLTNHLKH